MRKELVRSIAGALRTNEKRSARPQLILHCFYTLASVLLAFPLHRHIKFVQQVTQHGPFEHLRLAQKLHIVRYDGPCYHCIYQRAVIAYKNVLTVWIDMLSVSYLQPDAKEEKADARHTRGYEVSQKDEPPAAGQHSNDQQRKQQQAQCNKDCYTPD